MKSAAWVITLMTALILGPAGVGYAGKGMGSAPAPGSPGSPRLESEDRHQQMNEKGDADRGEQDRVRTRNYEEERQRLEKHYRERSKKLDETYNQDQKQLRTRYEEQKRVLEQERQRQLQQLEEPNNSKNY